MGFADSSTASTYCCVLSAEARKMRAEGRELVTRERTTEKSMGRPPLPSSYVKFEVSIPMIPDPLFTITKGRSYLPRFQRRGLCVAEVH